MSIQLKTNLDGIENSSLHAIPANIDHDGDANVCKYFNVKATNSDEPGDWKATFRGRPLAGKEIDIPSGYQGFVVKEKGTTFSDQQDRVLRVEKTFDKFMYWNLEYRPSSQDPLMTSLEWLGIANAIHTPVNVDGEVDVIKSSPEDR